MDSTKRQDWLDIAKGILIICVMMGHYGTVDDPPAIDQYLYWFHMPAFFIISGYLLKKPENWESFLQFTKKRAYRLLVPYFSFLFVITGVRYIIEAGEHSLFFMAKDLAKLLYGGQLLSGLYAPFWFITCLFFAQVFFAFLVMKVKKDRYVIGLLAIFYIFSFAESAWFGKSGVPMPFNVDVSLIAMAYVGFGYYGRSFINKLQAKHSIVLGLICLAMVLDNIHGRFNYELDLKYNIYHTFGADLIVPIVFSLFVLTLSKAISKLDDHGILVTLGSASLTIMYLHVPLNIIAYHYVHYGLLTFVVIGLAASLLVSKGLLKPFTVTERVFMGVRK
ncbi:acyltransferase family protein [Halobacillus salinarum]|uniref:Acyltransferase family protein n=1 Tax=Halobacillus salinarum TaxID=2932257 RepID=A0ABY4ELR1_9BACI|nr:acyltransferase family protein [Halobacillus salinarum]UOQ45383.1 acyltransferase family protein [Halobacillus salinarum]